MARPKKNPFHVKKRRPVYLTDMEVREIYRVTRGEFENLSKAIIEMARITKMYYDSIPTVDQLHNPDADIKH